MKKISALVLVLIIFNFIFVNYNVYAETTMSIDEYKTVADEGKASVGSSKIDVELKKSDVGAATSKFGTFLTSVIASCLKVVSDVTVEAGINPEREDSEYSAANTELFTINSLIFDEFELLNGKVYETPGSEIENNDSPIEVVNSIKRLCMRAGSFFTTVAIAITIVLLLVAIVKWLAAGTATDLAAWKKILARWILCLVLLFFFRYIFIILDVTAESITKGLYNIRLSMEANDYQSFEFTVLKSTIKMYEATGGVTSMGYALILLLLFGVQMLFLLKYMARAFSMILMTTIAPVIILIHSLNLMLGKESNILGEFFKIYIGFAFIPCVHQLFYLIFFFSLSEMAVNIPILGILLLFAIYRSESIAKAMFGWELSVTSIFK